MKKGLCLFLCMVTVAVTMCSCKSVKNKDAISDYTYVDSNGKVQVYQTDENGEYVTGKDGKPVQENFDVNKMLQSYGDLEALMPSTTTAKAGGSSSNKTTKTTKTTVPTTVKDNTKEELLDEGSKTSNTTLMKTVVEPVIKSGTFTIDGSIKAEGMDVATTFALRRSKDYSLTFNVGGFGIRVFSNNGKYYIALIALASYSEIPEDEFEGYKDMTDAFNAKDMKYVKTTKVKDGAITYTCEEYKSDDGTIKYYFNSKNEWKRMEIIDGDSAFIWKINSFKNTAKASLFEVSPFWKKNDDITKALAG